LVWALELSGALYEEKEGKERCRLAVAGLILGGEQSVLRPASLCLCDSRRGIAGRHDSIAKMRIRVDEKQVVAHLCPLCQKVLSLVREPTLGMKGSAPYNRMGAMREVANLWHR